MNVIALSAFDLMIAATLVIFLAALSYLLRLNMERKILIAGLRTAVQLMLIGWVLKILFENTTFLWVFGISVFMLLAAGREVFARQKQPLSGFWAFGIGTGTLFVSSFVVTILSLTTMISVTPWYNPQYAIPLLGMLLGNTMTGISIGVDHLTQAAVSQKKTIEQRLLLGQTPKDAIHEITQEAVRSALIPIVNAMAAAGIVSLPGMMTGQILAGSPPVEAVKYQIMIMFLIAAGTGFGSIMAVQATAARLFDGRDRLRLDRLRPLAD